MRSSARTTFARSGDGVADGDVGRDGAGEEEDVLRHDGEVRGGARRAGASARPAEDAHRARRDLVEPEQERRDGALARAGRADERDLLARARGERHVAEHGRRPACTRRSRGRARTPSCARRAAGVRGSASAGASSSVVLEELEDALGAGHRRLERACSAPTDRGWARRTSRCTRRTRPASPKVTSARERRARRRTRGPRRCRCSRPSRSPRRAWRRR